MDRHRVFVSFRNGDEPFGALLIARMLAEQLGPDAVFRDAESIAPGDDYVSSILAAVNDCDVMLAVIGPRWLTIADEAGQPKILNPDDWVHRELSIGLADGKRIVPILLDGATMPQESYLPPDLAGLARCQYRRLDHRQFEANMTQIIREVQATLAQARAPSRKVSAVRQRMRHAPRSA